VTTSCDWFQQQWLGLAWDVAVVQRYDFRCGAAVFVDSKKINDGYKINNGNQINDKSQDDDKKQLVDSSKVNDRKNSDSLNRR
jgi:hypothetical protein